jgi:hypothetical protein
MAPLPIPKRKFHTFLSHAHVDKQAVDGLYTWLTEVAGVPAWYDAEHLPPGATIETALPEAIQECRSMILVVSQASLASGWVKEEFGKAVGQRTKYPDYRILPVRLDDSPLPGFLETTKWLDLPGGTLDLHTANELLASLYGTDARLAPGGASRDVYVSRSWRESEAALPDFVCALFDRRGFRLIGDSKDQAGFAGGQRVRSIISSCGALVAVLPHRGGGKTSGYILDEIAFAREFRLPCLIVADPDVRLADDLGLVALRLVAGAVSPGSSAEEALLEEIGRIEEEWARPPEPHYVFFAAGVGEECHARNRVLRQILERVTAMPCVMGEGIREPQVQQMITDRIRRAFVVLADISEENLNTCIEAGVALGACRRLHLLASAPRRRPPFMFRDQQVWHYGNDAELVGTVHRIAYPYRRRVLNLEAER